MTVVTVSIYAQKVQELLTEESLFDVDLFLPCLLNSCRVAAYFKYSIMWFESTIMSGRRFEFIASQAQV
jgi:hypothetical protein